MGKLKVLIAAAGRGTRAGLPYPKTLFPINGKPILIHIFELISQYDDNPVVVVSPNGLAPIQKCLEKYNFKAQLLIQHKPIGMGDAVLHFEESKDFLDTKNVLLLWGDIPFIERKTLQSLIKAHLNMKNTLTFVTKKVDLAYTLVNRNEKNKVISLIETREEGSSPKPGERDIGLFIFDKQSVFNLLRGDLPKKYGRKTGEHGFLYIIQHMVDRGYDIEALPIASSLDIVSLNYLEDLTDYF